MEKIIATWTRKQLREHIEDHSAFVDQMTSTEYKIYQEVRKELRARIKAKSIY